MIMKTSVIMIESLVMKDKANKRGSHQHYTTYTFPLYTSIHTYQTIPLTNHVNVRRITYVFHQSNPLPMLLWL